MQQWNLDRKIQVSQTRLLEWYQKWNGNCYVSFSGGKDSTVLADLAARVCRANGYKLVLWFSNTGLEYPEIVRHVKSFPDYLIKNYDIEVELIMEFPKDKNGKRITFKSVVEKYGYPIISKEIASNIEYAKENITNGKLNTVRVKKIKGEHLDKNGNPSIYNCKKYAYLLDAPFNVSAKCCTELKKKPAKHFEKRTGLKPITGTMASESMLRKTDWLRYGCNAFNRERPQSKPLSFWTDQDVLKYIKETGLPISDIYGDVLIDNQQKYYTTGCNRTGCMWCGFGCHLEKEPNKFQKLKQTHPKIWEYCMKPWNEGGLGMKEVLEYIGVKTD